MKAVYGNHILISYSLCSQLLHFYIERYGAQYIGTSDELPEPTESAIISGLERVILTSAPYQTFLMKLREVSLWKQPKRSACYMAVYFVLWWYDCLTGSAVRSSLSSNNPNRVGTVIAVCKRLGLWYNNYWTDAFQAPRASRVSDKASLLSSYDRRTSPGP